MTNDNTQVGGPLRFTLAVDRKILRRWRAHRPVDSIVAELVAQGIARAAARRRVGALLGLGLNPVDRAIVLLDGRALPAPDTPGGLRLDGAVVRVVDVVRLANRRLSNLGQPSILYPGV